MASPESATSQPAAPSENSEHQIWVPRAILSRVGVCRAVSALLLRVSLALLAGCMGLSGQSGGGSGASSPTPNPGPTPTPTPTPVNPTATITVNPTSVQQGDKVTVSWQTQNATSVALTQNGTSVPLDGNPLSSPGMPFTLNTIGTTTFTLTAISRSISASARPIHAVRTCI